jgi:hypothetical protein
MGHRCNLGMGQWYTRKDVKELHMRIYVFIEEKMTKWWKKLSHNEKHEAPFKFNNRFTVVKVVIEMCTHIGSTIMYHVYRNKIKKFNKTFSLLQTCSLNATFFHDIHLTCEKEIPSNSFGLLASGEAAMLRVLLH